jgi:hypothetical protein
MARQRHHPLHDSERVGAAIDEIANQPQAVTVGAKLHSPQQCIELDTATLEVADRPGRHQWSKFGIASVKAGIGTRKRESSSRRNSYEPCMLPTGVVSIAALV